MKKCQYEKNEAKPVRFISNCVQLKQTVVKCWPQLCFYVFDQAWMRVWSFTVRPGTHEASLCHAQARCTLKVWHITHTNTSEIYIAEKRCWYLRLTPKTNTSFKNYCITKITKVCMVKMDFVDHLFTCDVAYSPSRIPSGYQGTSGVWQ